MGRAGFGSDLDVRLQHCKTTFSFCEGTTTVIGMALCDDVSDEITQQISHLFICLLLIFLCSRSFFPLFFFVFLFSFSFPFFYVRIFFLVIFTPLFQLFHFSFFSLVDLTSYFFIFFFNNLTVLLSCSFFDRNWHI